MEILWETRVYHENSRPRKDYFPGRLQRSAMLKCYSAREQLAHTALDLCLVVDNLV